MKFYTAFVLELCTSFRTKRKNQSVIKVKILDSVSFEYKIDHITKIKGLIPTKDIQTPLRNGPISMKDAHSAESNEKSILRFYFLSYG